MKWTRTGYETWESDYEPTTGEKISNFVNGLFEAFENVVVIAFFVIALVVGPALFFLFVL
jgi:hypothetical protein